MNQEDKKRILFLIDNLKLGGAQKVVLALSKGLDPDKYETFTICLGERGAFYDKFVESKQNVTSLDIVHFWHLIRLFRIVGFIRRNKIDVVHSFLFYSNFFGRIIGKLCGVKLVICSERATGVWKNRMFRLLESVTKGFVDIFTAVSGNTKKYMVENEGIDSSRIFTIYNGVEVEELPDGWDPDSLRKSLGIKAGSVVVGSVGRLANQKGFEYLIRAFKKMSEKFDNACLIIVGSGSLEERLKEEAVTQKVCEKVIFTGYRDDIIELLQIMDIYVVSSWWEGMSNSLLEAMAHKLPVVATAVDGNKEVVVDGETGILVPPQNEKALAEALINMLSDPSLMENMGEAGSKRVKRFFSIRGMIKNYNDFYKKTFDDYQYL